MVEKVDGAQVAWLRGLKFAERQAMRDRAAFLDRLSATGTPTGPVRLAILVGESDSFLDEAVALAYELGAAGQILWLYTAGTLPVGVPADFHERVCHINRDPARPLVEQLPPADLFLTPDPTLLADFYRAERSLVYWYQHGTPLPDGWAGLPARILTTGVAGTTVGGRPAFPVAPGVNGWVLALAAAREVVAKDPFRARRPRVSLCMIVKNEEKHLQNCLLSVYGVVDEICVVDTGSTDRTVQIAKRLGAKVEQRAWRHDFAWARNESLAMATGDWILQLDADEILSPNAKIEVPQLVRNKRYTGFLMPIESVLPSGISRNYVLRLFPRRPEIVYRGRIHEHVGEAITALNGTVLVSKGSILHVGYVEDPMKATGKRSRNRDLLLKALEEEPTNARYHYYLGVEEYLSGNPEEALRLLEAVPFSEEWIEGEPATLGYNCHRLTGQIRASLAMAYRGTRAYPRSITLWVAQADLAYGLGEEEPLQEALAWLTNERVEKLGDLDYAAKHATYLLGCQATDPEAKERYFRKALPYPNATRALLRHWLRTCGLAETIRKVGELQVADSFPILLQALSDLQDWASMQVLLDLRPELRHTPPAGALFLAQGRPEEALTVWQESGAEGWHRFAAMVALLGGHQLVQVAEPHLTPLESLAVQDMVNGRPTWRWNALLPTLCNINNPGVIEQLLARAPFLAEAVMVHLRLNVLP